MKYCALSAAIMLATVTVPAGTSLWLVSIVSADEVSTGLESEVDGSIIEVQSGATPAASVLGQELRVSNAGDMQEAILTPLLDRYAADQGIEVEPGETGAFLAAMQRGEARQGAGTEDDLTPDEAAEIATMRHDMANAVIRRWKINRSLYDRYGGRIIYQQFGPAPLDAYRQFLEERHAEGAFEIHDQSMTESFWRYFTDDSIHDFMEPGSADKKRAFTTPPWQQGS